MSATDKSVNIEEQDLLSRISVREEQAFSVIYNRYHPKIYTFIYRLLKSRELAEEVMQESFLKVWLSGERLLEIKNIEAYLVTISKNKCLDVLRRKQVAMRTDSLLSVKWTGKHNETEESILLNDTKKLLQSAIDQLPPQQRLIYELCHIKGLKYQEAAEKLDLSPLTVKTHMQHALRFLRAYMLRNSDIAVVLLILKIF